VDDRDGSRFGALGKHDVRPVALKVVIQRQEKVAAGLRAFIVMAESERQRPERRP
jgi:hypothetical protein